MNIHSSGQNTICGEQKDLLNLIFDKVSDIIFIVDMDKKFVRVNASAEILLQKIGAPKTLDEFYNRFFITDFDGHQLPMEEEPFHNVFLDNYFHNKEICFCEKNGRKSCYYVNTMLFKGDEGRDFAIGIFKDCTDYYTIKGLNTKCEKKIDELKSIINTISEGVAIVDADGNYVLLNPACNEIFQYQDMSEEHELKVGFTFQYVGVMDINGNNIETNEFPIFKILQGQSIKNKMYKIRVKGTNKYISCSGVPIFDSMGKIEYGVMTFTDITEIQRQQNRIKQQNQFIQDIIDGLGTPVATIKYPQYRFEIVNDQYCKMIGELLGTKIHKEDLIGRTFQEVVPQHYVDFMSDADSVAIGDMEIVPQILEYKDSNNETRSYQIVQSPTIDDKGQINYITAVGIEVTDQIKAKKEADDLAKMKEEYFTVISHELRSPIAVVHSAIQMLTGDLYGNEFSGATQRMLNRIEKNTNRLLGLVNNFLDITKAEAGFMITNYSLVKFISFTETLLESLQPSAIKKSIHLELINECRSEEVLLDCEKYERILLNLLSNAIKFTGVNGHVKLYLNEDNQDLIIKIKDNGVGIPEDKLPRIFDRFYIVDGSLSRSNNGTGIGLSLVKRLVEIMKGKIIVESQVGEGSEFILYLPKYPDSD